MEIKTYKEAVEYYGVDTWLQCLIEESAELGKAASKLMRTRGIGLATPISEDAALENLHEEILDVRAAIDNVLYFYPMNFVEGHAIEIRKQQRLIDRLNEKIETYRSNKDEGGR